MLFIICIVLLAVTFIYLLYLLFSLKKSKEKYIKQNKSQEEEPVKYYATPLFPNREIMENALKIRDKLHDDNSK